MEDEDFNMLFRLRTTLTIVGAIVECSLVLIQANDSQHSENRELTVDKLLICLNKDTFDGMW